MHPASDLEIEETLIRDVNTSISEQAFSWFRGYAGIFSSMPVARHRLFVHVYARKHNDMLRAEDAHHLNAFSTEKEKARVSRGLKRPSSRAHECSAMKVIKRPAAHK